MNIIANFNAFSKELSHLLSCKPDSNRDFYDNIAGKKHGYTICLIVQKTQRIVPFTLRRHVDSEIRIGLFNSLKIMVFAVSRLT